MRASIYGGFDLLSMEWKLDNGPFTIVTKLETAAAK